MVKGCKSCPNCGDKETILAAHIIFPQSILRRWFIECDRCHWCGKTTMTLRGAKRAWNREARDSSLFQK